MQGFAIVKQVLSGDTLVLVGAPTKAGAPAPELVLGLSGVAAPRVARHSDQRDEPGGFEAREALRRAVVGRQVRFRVDAPAAGAAPPPGARQAAVVHMCSAPGVVAPGAPSVNLTAAAGGFVRVTEGRGGGTADEAADLAAAGRAAAAAGVGLHAPSGPPPVPACAWSLTPDAAAALAAELARRPAGVPAVVESVAGGGTLRVRLLAGGPGGGHAMVTVHMAGIAAPRAGPPAGAAAPAGGAAGAAPGATAAAAAAAPPTTAAGAAAARGPAPPGEPFGAEARAFTESRLLQREVTLHVGGADKSGALVGRVEHPAGDIALELVREGLARPVDWSAPYDAPAHVAALRAAAAAPRAARARVWAAYEPSTSRLAPGAREFTGRVVEAVSGDTLFVLVNAGRGEGDAPDERRVSLASVRAPRLGNARRGEPDAPWAHEAREWLRKAVVGRDVTVAVDYTRDAGAGGGGGGGAGEGGGAEPRERERAPPRLFGTVTYETRKGDRASAAAGLLEAGLGEVARHRADEDRSREYDALVAAEAAAKAAGRGVHGAKPPPERRVADLGADAAKARAQAPFLKRAGTLKGVVEHVFAGGRLRVWLPSEGVVATFGIAGVRCPATERAAAPGAPARAGEPLGPQALQALRELVLQADVEVEADECDRNGVLLGPVCVVGRGGGRRNVGEELLRRGLARGVWPVIERVKGGAELVAAEADARAARRGVWAFEPAPGEDEGEGGEGGGPRGDAFSRLVPDAGASHGHGHGGARGGAAVTAPPPGGAGSDAPASASASAPPAAVACVLVDITDGRNFTLHAEADRSRIDAVAAALAAMDAAHASAPAPVPDLRKGRVLAALVDDGAGGRRWARARVEGHAKPPPPGAPGAPAAPAAPPGDARYHVTYIDVGNSAVLTAASFRPLEPPAAAAEPPLARRGGLFCLRVPPLGADGGPEAAAALAAAAYGRPLLATAHGADGAAPPEDADAAGGAPPRLALTLVDAESGASVNDALVAAGLARVSRAEARRVRRALRLAPTPRGMIPPPSFYAAEAAAAEAAGVERHADYVALRAAEAAQERARAARVGMWVHGDVGDSDLEEDKARAAGRGGAWGRR